MSNVIYTHFGHWREEEKTLHFISHHGTEYTIERCTPSFVDIGNAHIRLTPTLAIVTIPIAVGIGGRSFCRRPRNTRTVISGSLVIVVDVPLCSLVVADVAHELKHEQTYWPSILILRNERVLLRNLERGTDFEIMGARRVV